MLGALTAVVLSAATSVALVLLCYWVYAWLTLPPLESLSNFVDKFSQSPDERDFHGAQSRGVSVASLC